MVEYYKEIYHTNSSDKEETVLELYSSEEEPVEVIEIGILNATNPGTLRIYIEREKIGEIPTETANIFNSLPIPINAPIPKGQKLKITLQNKV